MSLSREDTPEQDFGAGCLLHYVRKRAGLNPQEATNQDAPDMGVDGADLAYPGSSVVVDQRASRPRLTCYK
jgi:hypothetical protein